MAFLTGLGVYLPQLRMTAAQIARASGLPDWVVREKLGIEQKCVPGPNDHPTAMAVWAAQNALEEADLTGDRLGAVISIVEDYREYPVWTSAPLIAREVGAHQAVAFDVNQKCATFITALMVAQGMLATQPELEHILIAGGYRNGDLIDFTDEQVRFMFDLAAGGGAVVLSRQGGGIRLLSTALKTDPLLATAVLVPVGGTVAPYSQQDFHLRVVEPQLMRQRLEEVSIVGFQQTLAQALQRAGYTPAELDYLGLLHMKPSAHRAVLEAVGLDVSQSYYLADYGHLGQLDPILSMVLARQNGQIAPGSLLGLAAAGVGYHWGAAVLRWEREERHGT